MDWKIGDVGYAIKVDDLRIIPFLLTSKEEDYWYGHNPLDPKIHGTIEESEMNRYPLINKLNKKLYPNYEEFQGFLIPAEISSKLSEAAKLKEQDV